MLTHDEPEMSSSAVESKGPGAHHTPNLGPSLEELFRRLELATHGSVTVFGSRGRQKVGFQQLARDIVDVCLYLEASGVVKGTRVGIRARNCYEWVVLDLALARLNAVSVCIPVPESGDVSEPPEVLAASLGLEFLVQDSPVGGTDETSSSLEWVLPLDRLLESTKAPLRACPQAAQRFPQRSSDALTVVFSSGTAGRLKRLQISSAVQMLYIQKQLDSFPLFNSDAVLDPFPLSTYQARFLVYCAIWSDCSVVVCDPEQVFAIARSTNPTILLGPPTFYDTVAQAFARSAAWKRRISSVMVGIANGLPRGLGRTWRRFVYRRYHERYGCRMRLMLVGSAPIEIETLRFFRNAAFELYQIYGLSEVGWVTWNTPERNRLGSVGMPVLPDTVHVNADGEVVVQRTSYLCAGYEDETDDEAAQVFRPDGSVATGDLGWFDEDGYLFLTGRRKNVIVTAGGRKVSPEAIEAQLLEESRIRTAVVFEDQTSGGLAAVLGLVDERPENEVEVVDFVKNLNKRISSTPILCLAFFGSSDLGSSRLYTRNMKIDRARVSQLFKSRVQFLGTFKRPQK